LIAPYECKHHGALFIASESGDAARGLARKSAYVCPRCGTFIVWIDGKRMTFTLVSDEQVAAAGVYAQRLRASE